MQPLIEADDNIGFIILISIIAALGGFLFGFDSGVINGTIDGLQQAFDSQSVGTGFNVASMLLGCAVGAFTAGRLADRFGRRKMLILAAILFIVSAWGSGISGGSLEFVIYRILGGFAVGAASVMTPAYISEIAPAAIRGKLSTLQQVAIISGLFVAFVSNYLIADVAGGSVREWYLGFEAWRWMFWVELIPATLFLLGLLFIPESPRFLVLRGEDTLAMAVLKKLYKHRAQPLLESIRQSVSQQRTPALSDLVDPVKQRIRPIVWVGIGLATFQQLVGINVVFYYGAVLWQAVGFSESDALLINVISGAVSIGACIATILLVDKIGRKPILFIGSLGMTVTLALMVFAFANAETGANGNLDLGNYGTLALVAANAYVVMFNFSWGPVMWVLLGEMFPNQLRGSGLAVAGLAQWFTNFLITMSFPLMLGSIGLIGAYGFYAICAAISIIFVGRYVFETRGTALEDMQG
ncbi:sugar porter family MFS transporter [Alteromonas oceanisediminis]|uniref:sugar porter family MFS transporter n=1 Tax=Alteromonas oceanisediminis TaxID=2836180 RepID=UPI001BD9F0F9|nr:sugar porter family MFS transporter [Alteromonas oceanisediminis]MBT0584976.1 sugar porter family MFS transporter [Alteromonas oceanisediminis]